MKKNIITIILAILVLIFGTYTTYDLLKDKGDSNQDVEEQDKDQIGENEPEKNINGITTSIDVESILFFAVNWNSSNLENGKYAYFSNAMDRITFVLTNSKYLEKNSAENTNLGYVAYTKLERSYDSIYGDNYNFDDDKNNSYKNCLKQLEYLDELGYGYEGTYTSDEVAIFQTGKFMCYTNSYGFAFDVSNIKFNEDKQDGEFYIKSGTFDLLTNYERIHTKKYSFEIKFKVKEGTKAAYLYSVEIR